MSDTLAETAAVGSWPEVLESLQCPTCKASLLPREAALECSNCAASYPIRDAILIVKDEVEANNRVARDFYDSPLWPRFRFWEKFTWFCNGGERRARNKVLQHLPREAGLQVLDVAIGDGVYLPWLPQDWRVIGIDVSATQLEACLPRIKGRPVHLIQGEAEALPLQNAQFDAILSIGAFNYFNDPEASLREMVRVGRPGAPVVISDELPNLTDRMLGHKLGFPGLDRWVVSRMMNLGDPFTDMVERLRDLDVQAIANRVLADVHYEEVWHGVGYVLVGRVPA